MWYPAHLKVTSDNPRFVDNCILIHSGLQACLLGGGPPAPPAHSTVGGGACGRAALRGDVAGHHRQVCLLVTFAVKWFTSIKSSPILFSHCRSEFSVCDTDFCFSGRDSASFRKRSHPRTMTCILDWETKILLPWLQPRLPQPQLPCPLSAAKHAQELIWSLKLHTLQTLKSFPCQPLCF